MPFEIVLHNITVISVNIRTRIRTWIRKSRECQSRCGTREPKLTVVETGHGSLGVAPPTAP